MEPKVDPLRVEAGFPQRVQYLAEIIGGKKNLASRVGMGRMSIWEFAEGKRIPPIATIHKIASRFPCSLEWLTRGEGDPPKPDPNRTSEAKSLRTQRDELAAIHKELSEAAQTQPVAQGRTRIKAYPGTRVFHAKAMQVQEQMSAKGNPIFDFVPGRFRDAIEQKGFAAVEAILGTALALEVRAGRAIPSMQLIELLETGLDLQPGWFFGLEE